VKRQNDIGVLILDSVKSGIAKAHFPIPLKIKIMATKKKTSKEDPCWKGYERVGSKEKNGKKVPNCVPEKKK